jgi:hypothetical protein
MVRDRAISTSSLSWCVCLVSPLQSPEPEPLLLFLRLPRLLPCLSSPLCLRLLLPPLLLQHLPLAVVALILLPIPRFRDVLSHLPHRVDTLLVADKGIRPIQRSLLVLLSLFVAPLAVLPIF